MAGTARFFSIDGGGSASKSGACPNVPRRPQPGPPQSALLECKNRGAGSNSGAVESSRAPFTMSSRRRNAPKGPESFQFAPSGLHLRPRKGEAADWLHGKTDCHEDPPVHPPMQIESLSGARNTGDPTVGCRGTKWAGESLGTPPFSKDGIRPTRMSGRLSDDGPNRNRAAGADAPLRLASSAEPQRIGRRPSLHSPGGVAGRKTVHFRNSRTELSQAPRSVHRAHPPIVSSWI